MQLLPTASLSPTASITNPETLVRWPLNCSGVELATSWLQSWKKLRQSSLRLLKPIPFLANSCQHILPAAGQSGVNLAAGGFQSATTAFYAGVFKDFPA